MIEVWNWLRFHPPGWARCDAIRVQPDPKPMVRCSCWRGHRSDHMAVRHDATGLTLIRARWPRRPGPLARFAYGDHAVPGDRGPR